MRQINPFSDERLLDKCVYCGRESDTADHVPSKIFIDEPFPENMPVVPACKVCNLGFSLDEQYLSCLIDYAKNGAVSPEDSQLREKVRNTLKHTPKLAISIVEQRILNANGVISFRFNKERVEKIILKLAKGHTAYELSEPKYYAPTIVWYQPISCLSADARRAFETPPDSTILPEIGSRAFQKTFIDATMHTIKHPGWQEVQEGSYRYLAVVDAGALVRIVLSNYLACEVLWK